MSLREKAVMAPLIAMTLLLGIYPAVVTDRIGPSVAELSVGGAPPEGETPGLYAFRTAGTFV